LPTRDFPIEALAPVLQQFIWYLAEMTGVDRNACALTVLAACAGAIDQSSVLEIRDMFEARPRLWALLCGSSSILKSPPIKAATRRLVERDRQNTRDWEEKMAAWEAEPKGERGQAPKDPVRYVLRDTLPEVTGKILANQGRGCMLIEDELSGWIGSFDKYSAGKSDAYARRFWLKTYDGGPNSVDRIGRASNFIDEGSMSILGAVQPARLAEMGDLTKDGLLQRFIPVMMREAGEPQECAETRSRLEFEALLDRLMDLPPRRYGLSPDAQARFRAIEREIRSYTREEGLGASLVSFIGKLTGMTGSIALILHVTEDPSVVGDDVDVVAINAAWQILRDFSISHARALYQVTTEQGDRAQLQRICSFVLTTKSRRLRPSDFTNHSTLRLAGLTAWEVTKTLSVLVACGWLEEERDESGQVRAWTTAPDLHKRFAERREVEVERKARVARLLAELCRPLEGN
jgi:hypothetical protein